MFTDQYPSDKPLHICKECGFEIERNGHSRICPFYTYKSWQDFNASEQKKILEESAKQGAEDQERLTNTPSI